MLGRTHHTSMRVRKCNVLAGLALLAGMFFFTYLVLEPGPRGGELEQEGKKLELQHLESKLKTLESDLALNQNIIQDIKGSVKEILRAQEKEQEEKKATRNHKSPVNKTLATIDQADTTFSQGAPQHCDIDMEEVYKTLPFDNPDGGVWKQGWDVQYKESQWSPAHKLRIVLVPHSHNDPGWIKTFERYYEDQTKNILNQIVRKLEQYPNLKFIWAEISYLSLWWAEQSPSTRESFIKLLNEDRLEIVTGGYVMPDEANSHYTALLEQLMFGHEWCNVNLEGYKPNSGWSIDPFGMSPTSAYLLKRSGFDNMLIQRTHYSVKKHLAKEQALEFKWRQHWDHQDTTDILCHMMPFYSYDIPHTCGPDPKVCCQFDFLRLPGGKHTCPWRVTPKKISQANVAERSLLLLDQYRKKSQLYKTDVLFVPLGDDFRWDSAKEFDDQYTNYQQIMDHINSNSELHAEMQWGTLSDYFDGVRKESVERTKEEVGLFPSLSGDFFTYADRDDHYWSGYFTSRPFWKNLDRVLEGYLRAAEIAYSLAWAEMEYIGSDKTDLANSGMAKLLGARQALSLFQHHDGITGTAKDHVVLDYGEKMVRAIKELQEVISQSTNFLLTKTKSQARPSLETTYFDLDDSRTAAWSLSEQTVIQIEGADAANRVVVYNSHGRGRQELVTFKVSRPDVLVYFLATVEDEEEEEVLQCQLSPVFTAGGEIQNSEYYLTFLARVPALGLQTFFIRQLKPEDGKNEEMTVGEVRIFHSAKYPFQVAPFDAVSVLPEGQPFTLGNAYIVAEFSGEGMLQTVTTRDDNEKTRTRVEFVSYGTRRQGDRSGAYLFLPDGPGKVLPLNRPVVRVVEGRLRSQVEVITPWVKHVVVINSSPGVDGTGIQIENQIDLTSESMNNHEIAMRITSNLQSKDTFYTDLNGFQMIRRTRYQKLPIQANFYPVPSMGYIQDNSTRISIISGQPLGGTSAASGQIEVMLDRRLMQDDNRGLFQGVQDNKITPHHFTLLIERTIPGCSPSPHNTPASYPSLLGHAVRHGMNNPMYRLIYMPEHFQGNLLSNVYQPTVKDLPCDIHLINLRTMIASPKLSSGNSMTPSDKSALVVHRQGFTSCYRPLGMTCSTNGGKISMDELFPELYSTDVKQMSLSLMYDGMKMEKSFTVSIQPMEMYSFLLTR